MMLQVSLPIWALAMHRENIAAGLGNKEDEVIVVQSLKGASCARNSKISLI